MTGAEILVLVASLADVPADDRWLTESELATLATLRVPKRRADWRLGRWTAKRALREATGTPDAWSIRAEPDGSPRAYFDGAPAPFVISLSHSAGLGACAVAGPLGASQLGCDVELVEERSPDLVDLFFTAAERDRVARAEDGAFVTTLLWSAKESALKALRTGLRADTRSVEISFAEPRAGGWGSLQASLVEEGTVLHGHWRRALGAVLTLVAAPTPSEVRLVPSQGARYLFRNASIVQLATGYC